MWKWFFSKVIKVREQVVADLGLNMPARPYEEHLDDFLTMLLRMAVTLTAAIFTSFFFAREVLCLFFWPMREAFEDGRFVLVNVGCFGQWVNLPSPDLISPGWLVLAVILSVPVLFVTRMTMRCLHACPHRKI